MDSRFPESVFLWPLHVGLAIDLALPDRWREDGVSRGISCMDSSELLCEFIAAAINASGALESAARTCGTSEEL